jgi:N-acetylglutamate synthase-like GNAT family acetyltransferase
MVSVVTYDPKYQTYFVELNREWIELYFVLEPMDLAQLEDPHGTILNHGGEILFVLENGEPVGTCAMIPHGERCYELAKMAVAPKVRGRGYGDILMKAAIDWARENGAQKIMLLSNTILEPADLRLCTWEIIPITNVAISKWNWCWSLRYKKKARPTTTKMNAKIPVLFQNSCCRSKAISKFESDSFLR